MKQAIIVRKDLSLGKGKLAVQVAHAAVSSALKAKKKKKKWFEEWTSEGQKKVALKVENLEKLKELYKKANSMNLPCEIIKDAGLTQIPPGTTTCLGIGPAPEKDIDELVGNLSLL